MFLLPTPWLRCERRETPYAIFRFRRCDVRFHDMSAAISSNTLWKGRECDCVSGQEMGVYSAVYGCNSFCGMKKQGISMFTFPKEKKSVYRKWVNLDKDIGRAGPTPSQQNNMACEVGTSSQRTLTCVIAWQTSERRAGLKMYWDWRKGQSTSAAKSR